MDLKGLAPLAWGPRFKKNEDASDPSGGSEGARTASLDPMPSVHDFLTLDV